MKQKISILILFICFGIFSGCEKDDICPESEATTPLLVIRFLDADDPSEFKNVTYLTVKSTSEENNLFTRIESTDSIAIPLKTDEEFTTYEFIQNDPLPPVEGEEEDDPLIPNSDIVNFSYAAEQVYLNRACGYIVNYTLNNATVEPETPGEKWINEIDIIQPNVENEAVAHIYIYH